MALDVFMQEAVQPEESTALQLFSQEAPTSRTPAFNNKLAAELASVRALAEPDKPYMDLYEDSRLKVEGTPDPRSLFIPYVDQYKAVQTDQLKAKAVQRIKAGEDPNIVLKHLALTKQFFDENDQWDTNVLIKGVQTAVPFDMYEEMDRAADARPFALLHERVSAEGRDGADWEDVADIASLIVWPDNTFNDHEVVRAVNATGLMQASGAAEMSNKYRSLTPYEKELFWEQAFPKFYDQYDGNTIKIAMAVSRVLAADPDYEQKFSAGMDLLTLAGTAFDAVTLYKGAKALLGAGKYSVLDAQKTQNAIKNLRDAGAQGKAADAQLTQAAVNPEARQAAAMNASPYNFEGTVLETVETVDGLAPEISARVQQGMNEVKDLDGALQVTQQAVLEQRASELDIWVEEELASLGGQSVKQIEKELESLRAARETEISSGRGSKNRAVQENKLAEQSRRKGAAGDEARAATESVADLDARIARLESLLDKAEGANLGKQYARTMRAGRVPKEFEDDVRAAQGAMVREWEAAPVNVAHQTKQMERSAQEAEIGKMRDELNLELKANPRLSSESLAALKVRAAKVNNALNIARRDGDEAAIARLEAEAERIKAEFQSNSQAMEIENQLRALDNRELNKAQRDRLRNVVQGVRNSQSRAAVKAQPARQAQVAPDATEAALAHGAAETGKYSADAAVEAAITEGVQGINTQLGGYKSGEAFVDVARMQFARNQIENARAEFSASNRAVRNAEVTKIDENGLTIKYTLENGEEVRDYRWDVDAMGEWTVSGLKEDLATLLHQAATHLLSPQALYKGIDKDMVANFTLGGMQTSAIYNNLTKVAKGIFKNTKLNKEQIQDIERLLVQGDLKGEVYSADALLYTNNIMGKKWSPEEVMAYFQWRALYDNLADVQNAAVHRMLSFQGYRELSWAAGDDVLNTMLRKATSEEAGTVGTRISKGAETESIPEKMLIASDAGGDVSKMSKAEIDEAVDKHGYQLYRLYGHKDPKTGTTIKWALVKPGEKVTIKPLRKQVLHKVTGYMPRIYQRGMYFVKDKEFNTVAGFEGRKQAQEWVSKQGKLGEWQVHADQALPPDSIELDRLQGMGGLWFMPRRGDPVMNPYTEQALARLDIGQSTQVYLTNVAELLPLNEYRHGLVRQFQKAVQAVASKNGKQGFSDITDPLNARIDTGNNAADNILEEARSYIVHQLGQSTLEESKFGAFMGSIVDYMEGKAIIGGWPRDFAKFARAQDPVARAKAGVFHAYLGSMNFAQLFVQAQNAVVAASVYPQHALPAFYDALKMRAVYMMDKDAIDALSELSHIDLSDAAGHMAAMKRSGYLDSIYRQDAFQSQLQGFGGNTLQGARAVLRTGAIPFEEGELFSRLVAFNIAKREFLASTKKKVLTDLDLHAIVQNSLRINLNMQKENAAMWQKNWLTAIPTQFLQVQAKFAEQVVGGLVMNTGTKTGKHTGLTRWEAGRALAGQLAMYGVVGVPLGEQMMQYFAKAHGYVYPDGTADVQAFYAEMPEAAETYSQGAMGIGMSVMGFNTNVSERFSIVAGLDDNIVVTLADAIINVGDPANQAKLDMADLAPGMGVLVRTKDTVSKVADRIRASVAVPSSTPEQMIEAVQDLATIASSWNNYEKLRLWRVATMKYSKAANATVAWKDTEMNFQTQFAAALGFTTESEHLTWEMADELRGIEGVRNNVEFLIRKSYLARMDREDVIADVRMDMARELLGNELEFKIMQSEQFKRMYGGESMEERVRGKSFKEYTNGNDIQTNLTEAYK